mmetsp:Transcript_84324/g.212640  ORF Transcript_84324/g.212640 Transcript_84324/m.212640 type:complete len:751 (+) Transcript_84324:114-2366(+)
MDLLMFQVCSFVLVATLPPLSLTVACTSMLSSCGERTYFWLNSQNSSMLILSGVTLGVLGHLFDVLRWKGVLRIVAVANYLAVASCLFMGLLCLASTAPSVPIIVGMLISILGAVAVRCWALQDTPTCTFMHGTCLVFGLYAGILAVIWLVWATTPFMGGKHFWGNHQDYLQSSFSDLSHFVLWCSPLILSIGCFLVSLFSMLRDLIHSPNKDEDSEHDFLSVELRLLLYCLALALFGAWVAASLAGGGLGLSKVVLNVSTAMGASIAVYVGYVIGLAEIRRATRNVSAVNMVIELLHSDIAKGAFMLLAWPLLPVYFVYEVLHQAIRSCQKCMGVEPNDGDGPSVWITAEAKQHWEELVNWNRASVLERSMLVGIFYVTVQVGVSQGVTVFLSWLSDEIAPWSLPSMLAVLFAIGEVMFLLPPVPGLPIYLISGIVVVQRCLQDGRGFWVGVAVASVFSVVLKMVAVFLQQKAIGESFSRSVKVKKLCAIHTPTMKAVRHILSRPGLDTAKVAVLVGGPDWPTSVLTGILRLNAGQMLLGTTPIILLIVPVVFSGAFMLQAAQDKSSHLYSSLAQISSMLSSIVMVGMMVGAVYHIESVQQQFKAEIEQGDWEKDPQEGEVLQAIEEDEQKSKAYEHFARWNLVPSGMQVLLYFGSMIMSASIYLVLLADPFESFSIADHVSDLPGGSILALINTSGYAAFACVLVAAAVLTTFELWRSMQVRSMAGDAEAKPLTSGDPRVAEGVLERA